MESPLRNKTCSKCGVNLPALVGNFYKDSHKIDGLSSSCSSCCRKTKQKTYKQITSIQEKEKRRKKKEDYLKSEDYQLFLLKSKEKERLTKKRYRDKNRKKINEQARIAPKKEISPEKKKQYKKKQYEKLKQDPVKKYIQYLRGRMSRCLKEKGSFSVRSLFVCTNLEFKEHLSSLFKDGMTWDNYGRSGWHIDHIRPLSSFDLSNKEELIEAFSLKNLQPLWGSENCSKGSLYNGVRYKYK
jgi:hypothetical protein